MSDSVTRTGQPRKRLLKQVRDKLHAMHYSYRTEQAYLDWIKRFILFHGKRHPREMAIYWTHWTQSLIAGTVAPHAALRSDIHQRGP